MTTTIADRDEKDDRSFGRGIDEELARELRRPVTPGDLRFKIQSRSEKKVEVVAYIDARTVFARLNLLAPGQWHEEISALPISSLHVVRHDGLEVPALPGKGGRLERVTSLWYRCRLTVRGVLHEDVGTGDDPKAAYSDAVKRAAVKFGVGEFLYALSLPALEIGGKDHEIEPATARLAEWADVPALALVVGLVSGPNGARPVLSPANRRALSAVYARWLEACGQEAFGAPLAHGPGDQAPEIEGESGLSEAEEGERPDEPNTERVAAAASRISGRPDAATIARLGLLLLGKERDPDVRLSALLLTDDLTEALVGVIELVERAGWSARKLDALIDRAFLSEKDPRARREAFLAELKPPLRSAA
jgi:Rad52/22 family double-strand break repair protein